MKNRKNIIWICLLLITGILIGWLIRGGSDIEQHDHEHDHEDESGTTYTCSMHPQIRQDEPGDCPICGMSLVPASQVKKEESSPFVLEMTKEAVAMANVSTTKARKGTGEGKTTLTGKIKINEQKVKSLTANYPGRIEELFVNFTGQEIKKGEKLASIYSPELVNSQKELLEAAKIKDRQPSIYQAAKEKLRSWKISEQQIQEIETSGKVLTNFDIIADSDGVVWSRNIATGDYVGRGTAMFDLVDLSSVWVILDAYEKNIQNVQIGDPISFKVAAIPGREFSGRITFINPVMDESTRTIPLRAETSNPGGRLKPGMFVQAEISSTSRELPGLLVPKSSVLWTGPRSVVFVQVGNRDAPAFEMREVELGGAVGKDYRILSGINEGDELVSQGTFAVDAAAQLTGNYSMMLRPEVKSMDVPESFREQITETVKAYLPLKDAFVESDPQMVLSKIAPLKKEVENVQDEDLDQNSLEEWKGIKRRLLRSLEGMGEANEIGAQRKHFEDLSEEMIEAVELFGVIGLTLYRQFCPMAFDDQGAYWLSAEKEIKNPYFGDEMLTCGDLKETYEPGKEVLEGDSSPEQSQQHHH
ncbi:efflux RND transporter periplasmic adaptor subunit [Pleomorphovibrio marinus]|uniref:efflux RND transporter periplasmic adaptor subunit n=1 Tax=Pleomorphovibrio marinus TaxID=2164132 RepID=UPI000E0A3A01|nr:efflux RND transporter periplasmic adaptor subunit [Pleomorphovibrio marinus]